MEKRYTLLLRREAEESLSETLEYIRNHDGERRAERWYRSMIREIFSIAWTPRAWQQFGQSEDSVIQVKPALGHLIFFTADHRRRTVHILDVVHGARETKIQAFRSDGGQTSS